MRRSGGERRNEAKREKKRKERANATLTEARRGEKRAKGVDGEAKGGMGAGGGGASDMAFGRITTDDVALNSGRKKKKESKEALLRKVQARQKAIDDAGGEEGGGKAVAEKFAWEAALSRASGEKVLDDPKLLQKSIKREARAKKKSREKWEERTAKVKEQMDAAQNETQEQHQGSQGRQDGAKDGQGVEQTQPSGVRGSKRRLHQQVVERCAHVSYYSHVFTSAVSSKFHSSR